MPLSRCRIIAAYNRCASGIRAALPEHVPLLTLTTVCYTCSPLRDSGPHHYSGSAFRRRSIRSSSSWLYPLVGIVVGLSLSGVSNQHQDGLPHGMPTYRPPAFWCERWPGNAKLLLYRFRPDYHARQLLPLQPLAQYRADCKNVG